MSRTISTDECDTFDEVRKLLQRAFDEIDDINFVIAPAKEKLEKEFAIAEVKAVAKARAEAKKVAEADAEAKEIAEATALVADADAKEKKEKESAEQKAIDLAKAKAVLKKAGKLKGFVTMKTLLMMIIVTIFMVFGGNVAGAYVATDITSEIAANHDLLSEYLRDTVGAGTFVFTPIAAPADNAIIEGKMYYDITARTWYGSKDGSTWTEFETGSSVSLDAAYNVGIAITVDAGAVALTGTDAAGNVVFAIDQLDTGATNAFTITGDATKALIDFDQNGTGGDIDGTDDTWSISEVGAFVIKGSMTYDTADVLFDGTSAGEDIQYDSSANLLHFLDNAALGFGGSADGAADISMEYEGTGNTLDITGSGKTIEIGATGNAGLDVLIWGLSGDKVTFGEDESALLFVDYDIWLDDTSDVFFGTTKNIGFLLAWDSSKTMSLLAGAATDDFTFNIGVDQSGIDVGMYGTTASAKLLFDSGNDALIFDAIDIELGDEDTIEFGDSADALLSYDATKNQLEYRETEAGGDAIFQIRGGEAQEGVLIISADNDDDVTDSWAIAVNTSGLLGFSNDAVADTFTTDLFSIAHTTGNITLAGDIINEGADVIVMSTDDSYIFTSNDEAVTLQIQGNANAKSAILDLSADAAADNVDTWNFTVADGGALTIANDATATMTVSEAMDITGTITLAEDEVMSNAVDDTVSFTSNDNNMTLQILGEAAAKSAILDLSADAAADNADTWTHTVADGGAYTIANEGTATMTISEAVTISGVLTASATTTLAGAATATIGLQNSSNAKIANATHGGGAGEGIIASGSAYVTITSGAATRIAVLPTAVVGNIITVFVGANGFEMQTPDLNSPTINQVDCSNGDTNEAAIPANTISVFTCYAANAWTLVNYTYAGAFTAAITPDGI